MAVVALVGVTGFNTLFFRGLSLAPASDAGMIIPTMSPVFTAMAGMIFLGCSWSGCSGWRALPSPSSGR